TPINNSLRDFQHMIELFSRNQGNYFAPQLGIHSLPTYFSEMEKKLDREVRGLTPAMQMEMPLEVNEVEAESVLRDEKIFRSLVVQRSRTYARESQQKEAAARGETGDKLKIFPDREAPKVAEYSIKKTYGKLLQMVEAAFNKDKPLFALAIYYPLAYAKDEEKARLMAADRRVENQQQQVVGLIRTNFLKRFESSTCAFGVSCSRLLLKLLTWVEAYVQEEGEVRWLEKWKARNADVMAYVQEVVPTAFENEEDDADADLEDDAADLLSREAYRISEILLDCFSDLDQIAEFLKELRKFKPQHDDKLRKLFELLKKDLKDRKVLIFTQFSDTAKYLQQQLEEAGFAAVDEVDSSDKRDRGEVIRRFAPYYNGSSSPELQADGLAETQILISTDVLSEGLNLQDATRLINYDLHWNPVRLMQRIGRVDRRMNPDIEARIVADNPRLFAERGDNNVVAYWNFLPPEELNELLTLYKRVTHKTLRISKTFGIEGKKLLRPEDDFDALRDFTHALEGDKSPMEDLALAWQGLETADPALPAHLDALPGRLFSGKAHPQPGSRAVFFCYVLPVKDHNGDWTYEGGPVMWLLFDLSREKILDAPDAIAEFIRCTPDTPRRVTGEKETLSEVRLRIEKYLKNTIIKSLNIPMGQLNKPLLKCWMELA
ncbi:MAG: SWF/SNF helicase family protein, partial [Abitibacteriaceae bacterium]|nr:SWF/SNF helicase family protein [Abditibacteriaceae bacterium]